MKDLLKIFFKKEEENYDKTVRVGNFYNKIEYESNCEEIKPYQPRNTLIKLNHF